MKICVLVLVFFFLISCKESKRENISNLVTEWMGREIVYPDDMVFTLWGKDTVNMDRTPYTIVTYADSVGCISCKLQLSNWQAFIVELKDKVPEKVNIHFVFHLKDSKEMVALLRRSKFDYPVSIDVDDSFNKLNHLSSIMTFQTFLLNEYNQVIAIGNPIHNPKVKELYLNIIQGKEIQADATNNTLQTSVSVDNVSVSLNHFNWQEEQKTSFVIKNAGNKPLIIQDVNTSCGCTTVSYSQEPVQPGKEIKLDITYKADHPEHFSKTITVYCNTESSPIRLTISGDAK